MKVNIGDTVAYVDCWPYAGAHPDCWGEPHKGIVVPYEDPRLWHDTLAFPAFSYPNGPTQAQVNDHCVGLKRRGDYPKEERVGVVWEYDRYGNGKPGTDFVSPAKLLPYAEALAIFHQTKREALEAEAERRAARELAAV